jgi:hypothetical protein
MSVPLLTREPGFTIHASHLLALIIASLRWSWKAASIELCKNSQMGEMHYSLAPEWNEKGLAARRDWDGLPRWDSALLHLNFT